MVVLRIIEVIEEEKLLENVETLGNYLGSQLQKLKSRRLSISDICGLGLFRTIVLVKNRLKKRRCVV